MRGCLGCNACRYGKPCVQRDAFNDIAPKVKAADCVVFASPLYFWTLSARIKAFIERFYCLAEYDPDPPKGRYERYPVHDSALIMTSADVNYIGFTDRGRLLCGGCGDTNGPSRVGETDALERAYEFGRNLCENEQNQASCAH